MAEKRISREQSAAWLKRIWWFFYNYTGIRFVVLKFKGKPANDPNYREPPSGMVWILGMYIALFGLADQQYARTVDTARVLESNLAQHDTSKWSDDCIEMASYAHSANSGPLKPELFRPTTVIQSMFGGRAPIMDDVFSNARGLEQSARLNLEMVFALWDIDDRAQRTFEPLSDLKERTHIKDEITLYIILDWIDSIMKNYYSDKPELAITAKTMSELHARCSDALSDDPHSIHDSHERFYCTLQVLAWSCADQPDTSPADLPDS